MSVKKMLKNCKEGYEYPQEPCFIVNYGRLTRKAHLNNNIQNDKLHQLQILRR